MLHIIDKNQKHKEIRLAVVIPAYNEEKLIGKVLSYSVEKFRTQKK